VALYHWGIGDMENLPPLFGKAAREARNQAIRNCAERGMTYSEAAEFLGAAYITIKTISKRLGIKFMRKKNKTRVDAGKVRISAPSPRNLEIKALFDEGKTLQSIADIYGITRERVRQIVERQGGTARHVAIAERSARIADSISRLADAGKTGMEIAADLDKPYQTIVRAARWRGIKIPRKGIGRGKEILLNEVAAKVADGMSIRQACNENRALASRYMEWAKVNGTAKGKHGRWIDRSERNSIIKKMHKESAKWADIAATVAKVEGYKTSERGIINYAYNHKLVTPRPRGPRPKNTPRKPRSISPPKTPTDIVAMDTIRKTCVEYYGKASAKEIAARLGITRNSVIGHWFRARKNGGI
jgi:DNA-binding CsgD family transcriptional regulator/predicted transcriptional regulator